MSQIKAFSCGRGIIVAFHGGALKTCVEYWAYRNGTFSLISRNVAKNWFQRLAMTFNYRNHASSVFFSEVKLSPKDLNQLERVS